jgi:hypothetical protein
VKSRLKVKQKKISISLLICLLLFIYVHRELLHDVWTRRTLPALVRRRLFWRFLGDEALFILGLMGSLNSMDSTVHSVINSVMIDL